jgi:hypothetical protein
VRNSKSAIASLPEVRIKRSVLIAVSTKQNESTLLFALATVQKGPSLVLPPDTLAEDRNSGAVCPITTYYFLEQRINKMTFAYRINVPLKGAVTILVQWIIHTLVNSQVRSVTTKYPL